MINGRGDFEISLRILCSHQIHPIPFHIHLSQTQWSGTLWIIEIYSVDIVTILLFVGHDMETQSVFRNSKKSTGEESPWIFKCWRIYGQNRWTLHCQKLRTIFPKWELEWLVCPVFEDCSTPRGKKRRGKCLMDKLNFTLWNLWLGSGFSQEGPWGFPIFSTQIDGGLDNPIRSLPCLLMGIKSTQRLPNEFH